MWSPAMRQDGPHMHRAWGDTLFGPDSRDWRLGVDRHACMDARANTRRQPIHHCGPWGPDGCSTENSKEHTTDPSPLGRNAL